MILDFSNTLYMDDSAALLVEQLIDVAIAEDTDCVVMGLRGGVARNLRGLNVLKHVPPDNIVETLDDAREASKRILEV